MKDDHETTTVGVNARSPERLNIRPPKSAAKQQCTRRSIVRALFTLSAVLWVSWIASIWVVQIVATTPVKAGERLWAVIYGRGAVNVRQGSLLLDDPGGVEMSWWPNPQGSFLRLQFWWPRWSSTRVRWFLVVPVWIPALTLTCVSVFMWRMWSRPMGANACEKCGYDCSGIANGTCPECGSSQMG